MAGERLVETSPAAATFAERQAVYGMELAYEANDAFDFVRLLEAHSHNRWFNSFNEPAPDRGTPEYTERQRQEEESRAEMVAARLHFMQISDAAGSLIGRTTLGGDYSALQMGTPLMLSFPSGAYSF